MRQIGEQITCLVGDGVDDERLRRQEKALLAHLCAASTSAPGPRYRLVGALVAACVLICGLGVLIVQLRQAAFSFWIDSELEPGREGIWLTATDGKSVPIRFQDGSTLDFVGPAAGQVQESREQQVTIALHSGHLTALVRSAKERTWTVRAGPFQVIDLGTHFSTWWQAERMRLEVLVYQGSVLVRGPGLSSQGLVLSSQERLVIDGLNELSVTRERLSRESQDLGQVPQKTEPAQLETQSKQVREQPTTRESRPYREPKGKKRRALVKKRKRKKVVSDKHESRDQDRPVPQAPGSWSSMVGYSGPPSNPDAKKTSRWLALYRQGRYTESVRKATELGLEEILSSASLDGLWKLAEAARYAERLDEAYRALQAVHRRFPSPRGERWLHFYWGVWPWRNCRSLKRRFVGSKDT